MCVAGVAAAKTPAVVILGIDGMDPDLLQQYVDKGVMPHFKQLMEEGSFSKLGTSIPPQSPVAWSNFITGMDPGGHSIFDFIHRNPKDYMPVFSAAEIGEPEKVLNVGNWVIPLSKGHAVLLRKGTAFWQILDKHDVPCTIFRVPANFPPAETNIKSLSGMGTPDILGTYGIFSFYTNDSLFFDQDISGGEVYPVTIENNRITSFLRGPTNTMRKDRPDLKREFTVDIDLDSRAAKFKVGKDEFILQPGEWSDWVTVEFDLMGPLMSVTGITRFYLRSLEPHFHLYATPINIDPANPALPISTPMEYVTWVHERIGCFYTQGMPEDTQALSAGVLSDSEFVSQTENVLQERWRMLFTCLDDFKEGLLFFYVSTIDQCCHVMWRNYDPHHPAHTDDLSFADHFEHLYVEMDSMLAVVERRLPKDATLIVLSDHGFAPYYKKFHLNAWLYKNGYMQLVHPEEIGQYPFLGDVFWRRTRAYGIGINSLYLNLLGREEKGIVSPGRKYEELLDEISRKLLAERDPETGEQIITTVYKTSEWYHGDYVQDAPDLIIGYNRGYRCDNESALGNLSTEVLTPNLGHWSGDHLMDHKLVPGVLLANRPILVKDPDLLDMAPTILKLYGIDPPSQMRGRVIFAP